MNGLKKKKIQPTNQKNETLQRYQTSLVHELSNLVITGNPFKVHQGGCLVLVLLPSLS